MDTSTFFPSRYLKSADFDAGPKTYAIDSLVEEDVGPDREKCPILYLKGESRGIVLNKTNFRLLEGELGRQSENWEDTEIEVYCTETTYGGQPTKGLRVRFVTAP